MFLRQLREENHQPSGRGRKDQSRSLARSVTVDSVLINAGNSTGFDADTSKVHAPVVQKVINVSLIDAWFPLHVIFCLDFNNCR